VNEKRERNKDEIVILSQIKLRAIINISIDMSYLWRSENALKSDDVIE